MSEIHIAKGWTIHGKLKWFVIQCSCGWETPLCALASRAKELLSEHRENVANQNDHTMRTSI